jgi:mRNA interferase YafQ
MRTIERASAFKKDFKRVKASPRHARDIDVLLATIVAMLVVDKPLPESNRDHALGGDWRGYRDCHVKAGSCAHLSQTGFRNLAAGASRLPQRTVRLRTPLVGARSDWVGGVDSGLACAHIFFLPGRPDHKYSTDECLLPLREKVAEGRMRGSLQLAYYNQPLNVSRRRPGSFGDTSFSFSFVQFR